MKLKEFKKIVDRCYDINEKNGELEIEIPNNKPTWGQISTTKVKYANQGID